MKKIKRVALYLRVSTNNGHQTVETDSLYRNRRFKKSVSEVSDASRWRTTWGGTSQRGAEPEDP